MESMLHFMIYVLTGAHDWERTVLYSCHGVFTDRFIFRLNFPRMRLHQELDNQSQEINLTSWRHRIEIAFVFFCEKDRLKLDRSVKIP